MYAEMERLCHLLNTVDWQIDRSLDARKPVAFAQYCRKRTDLSVRVQRLALTLLT